ncbi:mannan-binding lectin serine protease 2-like [Diprion similis]|uniref:mannan-binding lectin serine protease 2-like n=1 Tax=Diprion similis TaxID=362088 RepID=UPI001EF821F2|nr:mannan-binding lectin serine protease 2-like [Diprion similis]
MDWERMCRIIGDILMAGRQATSCSLMMTLSSMSSALPSILRQNLNHYRLDVATSVQLTTYYHLLIVNKLKSSKLLHRFLGNMYFSSAVFLLRLSIFHCIRYYLFRHSSSPKTSVQPPLSPMTTTTSTTTENQIDSQVPSRAAVLSCKVPPQPANGQWKLHPSICEGVTDCTVPQGTALRPGDQLVHSCMPGFRINGSPDVYCRRQGFWSPISTCIEITCHALESASMIATCYRFNKWQSCNSSVLPNTTAELTCRRAYKEDGSLLNAGRKTVTCSTDGKWEPRPITCLPVCGIANVQLTPTILNGSPADIVDFPWHATLYRQERPPQGTKEFKCGATIVQNNILLTAAHCVYDERFYVVEKPERFHVLTGNKFRDYDFPYHDPRIVRKAAVKSIHVPCEYSGLDGNYGSDVAILELEKPFRLSDILMPACMDVLGNNEQLLESGSVGRFAGFGRTESGTSSGILLTTNVAYVSYRKCKMSDGSKDNVGLISNDKFCGEGQNGMAVCQGDSGGGLVFDGDGRWHLMGILSANLGVNISNGEKTCDSNAYSLYTKVSSHVPWISKYNAYCDTLTVAHSDVSAGYQLSQKYFIAYVIRSQAYKQLAN